LEHLQTGNSDEAVQRNTNAAHNTARDGAQESDKRSDEGDNDPIGIILCAEKDRIVAEYALEGLSNNIYASRYTYIIPNKELLEDELSKLIKK
jgi:hypothetical protein